MKAQVSLAENNGTRTVKTSELLDSIRQLSENGKSIADMAAGLDMPQGELKETLEQERRKLALLFLGAFSQSLYEAGTRYRDILENVLTEIETRDLTQMRTRDLLRLADTIQKWLLPIYRAGPIGPDKGDLPQGPTQVNIGSIVALLQNINDVKKQADQMREV